MIFEEQERETVFIALNLYSCLIVFLRAWTDLINTVLLELILGAACLYYKSTNIKLAKREIAIQGWCGGGLVFFCLF